MFDSQRYRDNAADCLLAAEDASRSDYRKLNFLMAMMWLALARHDEAVVALLASWGKQAKEDLHRDPSRRTLTVILV